MKKEKVSKRKSVEGYHVNKIKKQKRRQCFQLRGLVQLFGLSGWTT